MVVSAPRLGHENNSRWESGAGCLDPLSLMGSVPFASRQRGAPCRSTARENIDADLGREAGKLIVDRRISAQKMWTDAQRNESSIDRGMSGCHFPCFVL